MNELNIEALPAALLFSHLVMFLLGFISWRILELIHLTGDRLRLKRKRGELRSLIAQADAKRRIKVLWTTASGDHKLVIFDCELRDVIKQIVANAEPFDCPRDNCAVPLVVNLAPGDALHVELSAANPLAIAAPITRIVAHRPG